MYTFSLHLKLKVSFLSTRCSHFKDVVKKVSVRFIWKRRVSYYIRKQRFHSYHHQRHLSRRNTSSMSHSWAVALTTWGLLQVVLKFFNESKSTTSELDTVVWVVTLSCFQTTYARFMCHMHSFQSIWFDKLYHRSCSWPIFSTKKLLSHFTKAYITRKIFIPRFNNLTHIWLTAHGKTYSDKQKPHPS